MAGSGIEPVVNTVLRPFLGSCHETQERLSEHLEGSLPVRSERRVARHLRSCRRCRTVYESLVRTVERLRAAGRQDLLEPAPSVAETVVERIRSRGP